MKRLPTEIIESMALQFRREAGLSLSEPVHTKMLLRKLGIVTMYRPMSEQSFGLSMRSADGKMRFMLINSNTSRGRQNFTICHELFHLYYDEDPRPHIDGPGAGATHEQNLQKDGAELNANAFASALLLPRDGVLASIPTEELLRKPLPIETYLRTEQLFEVSHQSLAVFLRRQRIISEEELQEQFQKSWNIISLARQYGYDTQLYEPGNEGLMIGDMGEKARRLLEMGRISQEQFEELGRLVS